MVNPGSRHKKCRAAVLFADMIPQTTRLEGLLTVGPIYFFIVCFIMSPDPILLKKELFNQRLVIKNVFPQLNAPVGMSFNKIQTPFFHVGYLVKHDFLAGLYDLGPKSTNRVHLTIFPPIAVPLAINSDCNFLAEIFGD